MALKTVQASSNLARPGIYTFSPCSPSYKPKFPLGPSEYSRRISTTKRQKSGSPSALKCRANLHGCTDEAVQSRKDQTAEIPIVLYPSVAFPGATLQLQAFEFRYRIMMHTLLQEGLRFGVVYSGKNCGMADVGCVVQVIECEKLIDGRFFLTCVVGDRFRVVETVRTKPYVVARIQVLDDDQVCSEPRDDMAGTLAQRVRQHLKNVAMLSEKLDRSRHLTAGDYHYRAAQLRGPRSSAASFSFLVARLFIDDRLEQQTLLQVDDTAQRLAREGMYLERRGRYLAAIAAIKDAFEHLSCNEK
jgi:Lon protease-like protein